MQTHKPRSINELTPDYCKSKSQCFVCDEIFKTQALLSIHQSGRHCEVIVFEIMRENKQIRSFTNLWRVNNFDDLLAPVKIRKHRIRKMRKEIIFEADGRTKSAEVQGEGRKCDD